MGYRFIDYLYSKFLFLKLILLKMKIYVYIYINNVKVVVSDFFILKLISILIVKIVMWILVWVLIIYKGFVIIDFIFIIRKWFGELKS